MQESYYDTYDGISKAITSLKGLNELIKDRHDAYYKNKQSLNEYYILGRYSLDSCGNMCVADNFIPAEQIPDFPKVTDRLVFWEIISEWQKKKQPDVLTSEELKDPDFNYSNNKRPYPISISFGIHNPLPPTKIICPQCQKGWTIDNCHDVVMKNVPEKKFDAVNYKGTTWGFVKNFFAKRTSAAYYVPQSVQNDKHIDLKLKEGYETLKENEFGIIRDIPEEYVIQEGDHLFYSKVLYYHKDCIIAACEEECNEHRKDGGKNYRQFNLAGNAASDAFVKLELDLAGIPAEKGERYGEPGSCFKGKLGDFTFERAWRYWIVEGPVPLEKAKIMYANEEGKKYVRVAGHCGCPPPEEWVHDGFVNSYHIDTWQGLKLFVDTVKLKARKIAWKD